MFSLIQKQNPNSSLKVLLINKISIIFITIKMLNVSSDKIPSLNLPNITCNN